MSPWNQTLHLLSYSILTLGITLIGISYRVSRCQRNVSTARIHEWVGSSRRRSNPLLALVDINYAIGYWNALCDLNVVPDAGIEPLEFERQLHEEQSNATLRAFGHFVQPSDLRTIASGSQT